MSQSQKRTRWFIGGSLAVVLVMSILWVVIRPSEAFAGGVVKTVFAERIRSYSGTAYCNGGADFEFTTDQGFETLGFIITDLVFSGGYYSIYANGVIIFQGTGGGYVGPIHLESGVPIPPGTTVSVRCSDDRGNLIVNLTGYNY